MIFSNRTATREYKVLPIGAKFGHLTITALASYRPTKYQCLCDCGTECIRTKDKLVPKGARVLKHKQVSCGCRGVKDHTGKRHGQVTVVRPGSGRSPYTWICQCDCGVEFETDNPLNAKSCGCLMPKRKLDIGQVINSWTIIEYLPNTFYRCRCKCGHETQYRGHPRSQACSSCSQNRIHEGRGNEFIGKRYGRLIVVAVEAERRGERRLICKCDCGNTYLTPRYALKNGATKSCGCWRRDRFREIGKQRKKVSNGSA